MPGNNEHNVHEQVDPEFRPFVEWLRTELGSEYKIVEQVEDDRRKQTVIIMNPARVLNIRVPLREGCHSFHPPQTPTDLATFLRHLIPEATGGRWLNFPPRAPSPRPR